MQRCLNMRCRAVLPLPSLPTPSEGVAFRRISLLLPKELETTTLDTGIRESRFNEFTSGCTLFFKRLKISNLQIMLHIWHVSKEGGCAVRFITI